MKAYKICTIIAIVLFIAIFSVSAFLGFYIIKDFKVRNIIPNYKFGKEYSESRVIELTVDDSVESTQIFDKDGKEVTQVEEDVEYTEENGYTTIETKVNKEEDLTEENYKISKKIIKNRLKGLEIEQYTISQDKETGKITLDITENEDTDNAIDYLLAKGVFQIVDSETQELLLDNSDIKSTKIVYNTTNSGTTVFLEIEFNKDGIKKLKKMSEIYVKTTVETEDADEETKQSTQTKEFEVKLDGSSLGTRYFEEKDRLKNGLLDLKIGSGSTKESIAQFVKKAEARKTVIDNGVMPIAYTETNSVKDNSINVFNNKVLVYSTIGVIIVAAAFLLIKLKLKGIMAIVLEIGYVALLLLTLKTVGIKITTTGIVAIAISFIINYVYLYIGFKNIEARYVKETTKKIAIWLIPVYIIAIVFTFFKNLNISSIGMSLVWGIIIMYLYNLSFTQITLKTIK